MIHVTAVQAKNQRVSLPLCKKCYRSGLQEIKETVAKKIEERIDEDAGVLTRLQRQKIKMKEKRNITDIRANEVKEES